MDKYLCESVVRASRHVVLDQDNGTAIDVIFNDFFCVPDDVVKSFANEVILVHLVPQREHLFSFDAVFLQAFKGLSLNILDVVMSIYRIFEPVPECLFSLRIELPEQ